jgi:hypothetical protein
LGSNELGDVRYWSGFTELFGPPCGRGGEWSEREFVVAKFFVQPLVYYQIDGYIQHPEVDLFDRAVTASSVDGDDSDMKSMPGGWGLTYSA